MKILHTGILDNDKNQKMWHGQVNYRRKTEGSITECNVY